MANRTSSFEGHTLKLSSMFQLLESDAPALISFETIAQAQASWTLTLATKWYLYMAPTQRQIASQAMEAWLDESSRLLALGFDVSGLKCVNSVWFRRTKSQGPENRRSMPGNICLPW